MRKVLGVLTAILLLPGLFCAGASGEAGSAADIRSANNISWAGADMVLVDDVLIRADTGTELMDRVSYILPAGRYAVAVTAENELYRLDRNGDLKKVELPDGEYEGADGACGLVYSWSVDYSSDHKTLCVYNAELDQVTVQTGEVNYPFIEFYYDPEGNAYYVTNLTSPCSIYRADGSLVYTEKDQDAYPVPNAQLNYQTNGCLTIQSDQARIVSAYTGEEIAAFDMEWAPYEMCEFQIYENNTAVAGKGASCGAGDVLIGLDGTILKELPDDCVFKPMWGNLTSMISFESPSIYGVYDVVSDRTYCIADGSDTWICQETGLHYKEVSEEYGSPLRCEETGEEFSGFDEIGAPVPEREQLYAPTAKRYYHYSYNSDGDRQEIVSPDGTPVRNSAWKDYPWEEWLVYDLECRYVARGYNNVWAVGDQNGLQGVINMSGEMVLPAEYDQVHYIRSFGDAACQEGFCLTAVKDQAWYVFDEQGREIFTIAGSEWGRMHNPDGTVTVTKYDGDDAEITIPGELNGAKVAGIGEYAFKEYSVLRKVTIPEGVAGIGNGAFYECKALESAVIPEGVTNIGDYVFYKCESLENIVLPNSLESIGKSAFYGCGSLTLTVSRDSCAEEYCRENELRYVYGNEPAAEETPVPASMSGEAGDQDPTADVPVLSAMFPGKEVQLAKLGGNERVRLFSGPGTDYAVIRKINPREKNTTTAYFIENDMVYVHYVHRSVDIYAYVVKQAFPPDSLTGIQEAEKLRSVSVTTKKGAVPKTGPGEKFGNWPESEIPEGSRIRCLFREENYCYAEYEFPAGPARVWVDTSVIGLSTILKADGFTLEVPAGAEYSLGDNETDQYCVSVKPYAAKGDDLTEISISRLKTKGEITVDLVRSRMPALIEQTEKTFSTGSLTVNSVDHAEPVSGTLGGESCVAVDFQVSLTVSGINLDSYMRYIYMSNKGFDVFIATSIDRETLEAAAALLNAGLNWQ